MSLATVGLLHPGEMGAAVGAALREQGVRVLWCSSGRSPETHARAAAASLEDVAGLAQLAAGTSIIMCICPPDAAVDVTRAVAGTGFSGLYVDANAIAPSTAVAIQTIVESAGATFVDGDVIGGPPRPGGGTRLFLSGGAASEVAELFGNNDRVVAAVLDGDATAASALKMCYAAWTKGTAALLLAIRAVAEASGVDGALVTEWQRSQPDLVGRLEAARRAAPKAWRFAGEMDEIARCFAEAGVPCEFHLAAAEVFRRLSEFKGTDPSLGAMINALLK